MSSLHSWSYHPSLVQPSLARELQPPPANNSPPSNSIQSSVDEVHTGVMASHDTRKLYPEGDDYRCSETMPAMHHYHDRAYYDYEQPPPPIGAYPQQHDQGQEGHTDEEDDYGPQTAYCDQSYYTYNQPPPPIGTSSQQHDHSLDHDHFSSQIYEYTLRRSDLDARVDPNLAPSSFVCPKVVHISNGDDQGQEGHTDEEDDYGPQTAYYDQSYYTYNQPPPPIGTSSQQHDHSLNHDHSGSQIDEYTLRCSDLDAQVDPNLAPSDIMMKPFPASEGEKAQKSGGEKTRGRGQGKKAKERKVYREHPGKGLNHASDYKKQMNQQHLRPFLCVFNFAGCNQTFGSKNEWKRHVNSQHLQLSYWRCDDSSCADRKIFNRKDLFSQHLKRMHPPPAGSKSAATNHMEAVIDRCRVERRQPPQQSRCGYCKQEFEGPQCWEQRMEHIGQHYEKNYKEFSRDWVPDEGLIKWALKHGIIEGNNDGSYVIISTEEDAIVKARVQQEELAGERIAGVRYRYADDDEYIPPRTRILVKSSNHVLRRNC